MNRRFLASVVTCFVIASVGSVPAQAPLLAQAPAAPAEQGAGRSGRGPASVATPEDLADIAKLANLPALVKGSGDGDFSTGPDYTPAPEETQRVGIPHGRLIEFHINSASSKVFPGVNGPFERLVSVYVPAQYVPGKPAPFIFSADSYGLRDRQILQHLLSTTGRRPHAADRQTVADDDHRLLAGRTRELGNGGRHSGGLVGAGAAQGRIFSNAAIFLASAG